MMRVKEMWASPTTPLLAGGGTGALHMPRGGVKHLTKMVEIAVLVALAGLAFLATGCYNERRAARAIDEIATFSGQQLAPPHSPLSISLQENQPRQPDQPADLRWQDSPVSDALTSTARRGWLDNLSANDPWRRHIFTPRSPGRQGAWHQQLGRIVDHRFSTFDKLEQFAATAKRAGVSALMLVQIQKTEACPGPWCDELSAAPQTALVPNYNRLQER